MSNENKDNLFKNIHGKSGEYSLKELIDLLVQEGFIKSYKNPYRTGYKDRDKNQFYFQFLLEFEDGEKWIVHSTTSIRSDRINIHQWNSYNIKDIEHQIKKSIVVYPDNIKERDKKEAVNYSKKIIENKIFSSIDYVVSQSEFYNLILEKNYVGMNLGRKKAFLGMTFEKLIVHMLNYQRNLEKWKRDLDSEVGVIYNNYKKIMDVLDVENKEDIKELNATSDIPLLPNRGKPKTDVNLKVIYNNGKIDTYNFSCKMTSKDWVSIHEYPADTFIKVLNIKDEKLKKALYNFQEKGAIKKMNNEYRKYLEENLKQYNNKLALWAYGGVGGDGNPKVHWANYIITEKNGVFSVYKLEDYVKKILKRNNGNLGTPFRWTYPSKNKGKSIQLKGEVI